jgi:hypothetical protein
VQAPEIQGQLALDEGPGIVVAGEGEGLALLVGEVRRTWVVKLKLWGLPSSAQQLVRESLVVARGRRRRS